MKAPLNIVFDFGAVLVNWRPLDVVRKHFPDRTLTPEAATALASQFFAHPDWQAFDAGRVSAQDISQRSANRLSLDVRTVQRMLDSIEDHITPIDSSVQVLESLHAQSNEKGYKLFFLSNMPAPYARGLERHAFMHCFEGGIFSGDYGLVKPQPEIYQKLEAMFLLKNQPILFIDDHPANIAAAHSRGWQTIHLTEPAQLPQLLTDKLAAL
jgi:putative hydrolase of the HAD superfamily